MLTRGRPPDGPPDQVCSLRSAECRDSELARSLGARKKRQNLSARIRSIGTWFCAPVFRSRRRKRSQQGSRGRAEFIETIQLVLACGGGRCFRFRSRLFFFSKRGGGRKSEKKKGNQTDERPFCLRPLCFFFLPFLAPFFRHQALNLLPFFPPGTRGDSVTSRLVWGRGRFRGLWWRRVPARW